MAKSDDIGLCAADRRAEGYRLYVQKNMTPIEIASMLGVDELEVLHWFRIGNWIKIKRRFDETRAQDSERRYMALVAEERHVEARRQLDLARRISAAVEPLLDNPKLNTRSIKDVVEALTSAAAMGARAAGVTEKASGDIAVSDAQNERSRQQLFVPGAKPLSPSDKARLIEPNSVGEPYGESPVIDAVAEPTPSGLLGRGHAPTAAPAAGLCQGQPASPEESSAPGNRFLLMPGLPGRESQKKPQDG